ncbi:GDCCVxC domain-containing (seleno)protein [Thalassotalea sp. ND16A]|uniref:GDCCVxC domain-containing (seleno)protein n=1 Tax=Thalassotalea sp. ND16A TaxID=1535422 RepID=UPI0009DE2B5E|nr:GDCCVxC domain-containing (seleno)protein [Thalassotalea sp. ND16A]
MAVILKSRLTCPHCGYSKTETMPTNACLYFYQCCGCNTVFKPLKGDCCVFCSYGNVKCPPVQQGIDCCH